MSDISIEEFETAKTEFTNMLPQINEKKDQLKALKKVHNVNKKIIYNYMHANEIDELVVDGYIFSMKTKERLAIKQEDIEGLLDAQTLAPFYESKVSYGVKRQRTTN